MNYYLGVDVGTSSVKSLLMDSEERQSGTSQIGYDIIKESYNMQNRIWRSYEEATKEDDYRSCEEISGGIS